MTGLTKFACYSYGTDLCSQEKTRRFLATFFPEVVLSDSCWKVTILTFLSGSIRSIGIFYCALAVGRWRQDFEPEVVRHILQAASKSLNVLEC